MPDQLTTLAASTADVAAGPLVWGGLVAFLAAMVLVDLRVGASGQEMTVRRAATWSVVWFGLALAFGAGLWALAGSEAGESYFAGYVMEKALSLDNVFVFTLIFAALAVPRDEQPRVLLYGILIALVLRGVFIFAGAEALETYSWVAWPFAALLAWTGWRILRSGDGHDEGAKIVERVRARFPGLKPAAAALAAVALADVIFAVDSVPLPAARPRRAADRHRRQARLRRDHRRQDPHGTDPRGDRRRAQRGHRSVPAQRAAGRVTPDRFGEAAPGRGG